MPVEWYENIVDSGDGSSHIRRYRTYEEAYRAGELELELYGIPVDGPTRVSTDEVGFFDEVEEGDE